MNPFLINMIFICTHKDFNLNNDIILNNANEYKIIDGNELKSNYPIDIIHETNKNNILYDKHNLYAELTRQYYIYKNLNLFDYDIIGFMQYKRFFNNYVLENYKDLLIKYDIIISVKYSFPYTNIITQYYSCHGNNENINVLSLLLDLIYKYNSNYRKTIDIFRNLDYIIPHNMFIMKQNEFKKYCKFIYWTLELTNLYCIEDIKLYDKYFAFLVERLNTLYYLHNFILKDKNIYYDDLPMWGNN